MKTGKRQERVETQGRHAFPVFRCSLFIDKKEHTMKKKLSCCFTLCLLLFPALPGAAQAAFTGSWAGDLEHNGAFRRYALTFRNGGSCTVRVTGAEVAQEAEGSWSYGGNIFKLSALFRNPALPGLDRIQWTSVVTFGGDGNSFNILAAPDSRGQDLVRITFFREDVRYVNDAVEKSFAALSKDLPARARIAIVSIAADDGEGVFLVDELTLRFVNARRFTMIERRSINAVLEEQNFQMSGYVDDNSAVSIGKFLGATVVITGGVNGSGARKRLVLKALDVLTAEILAMSSEAL
jgi:hypothetical protein